MKKTGMLFALIAFSSAALAEPPIPTRPPKEAGKNEQKNAAPEKPKAPPEQKVVPAKGPTKVAAAKKKGERPKRRKLKIVEYHKVPYKAADGSPRIITVQEVSNRADGGFNWGTPGGLPNLPKECRHVSALKDEEILKKAFFKIRVINEVNKRRGLGIPDEQLNEWYMALHTGKGLKPFEVRYGMKFDFGTAGDWELGNDALSYDSNTSVFYNATVTFADDKTESKVYNTHWRGAENGQSGRYEADLIWCEACGNWLVNIRFIPDPPSEPRVGEEPPESPNIVLEGPPITNGRPENAPPQEEFDKKGGGSQLTFFTWVQGVSRNASDGHGGYKIDGGAVSEYGAAVELQHVTQTSDEPNEDYFRYEVDLGGVSKQAIGDQTDEQAGAGFGPWLHGGVDWVSNGNWTIGADIYDAKTPESNNITVVPVIGYQPKEGSGIVGNLSYMIGSTSFSSEDAYSDKLKSKALVFNVGWRFFGEHTAFLTDASKKLDLTLRVTNQEYEFDRFFRTSLSGLGVGLEGLIPVKWWGDAENGVRKMRGVTVYWNITYDVLNYTGEAYVPGEGFKEVDDGSGLKAAAARFQVAIPLKYFGIGD